MLQADSELDKEQWVLPRYLVKKDALHWETARKHRKTWLLQWLSMFVSEQIKFAAIKGCLFILETVLAANPLHYQSVSS